MIEKRALGLFRPSDTKAYLMLICLTVDDS